MEEHNQGFVVRRRFTIANGQLRLRGGIWIDHETDPTVDLDISADGFTQAFTITVRNIDPDNDMTTTFKVSYVLFL